MTSSFFPGPQGIQSVQPIPHDVTSDRALNTIYRNTTGKPMFVSIEVETDTQNGSDNAIATLNVDEVSPPITFGLDVGIGSGTNAVQSALRFQITYIIPPNYYYELIDDLKSGTGLVIIQFWNEIY